jgi:hypothetical protein
VQIADLLEPARGCDILAGTGGRAPWIATEQRQDEQEKPTEQEQDEQEMRADPAHKEG